MTADKALFVKMVLDKWNATIKQTDDLLKNLSDEQLFREVAPTKNRGIYLLGHLTAAHDLMFRLLDLGNALFPDYKAIFLDKPDKVISGLPTVHELKQSWTDVNMQLGNHFKVIPSDEWFLRHTAISPDDFEKEPHRNKLNVVLTRSHHLSNHLGQLILLKN